MSRPLSGTVFVSATHESGEWVTSWDDHGDKARAALAAIRGETAPEVTR